MFIFIRTRRIGNLIPQDALYTRQRFFFYRAIGAIKNNSINTIGLNYDGKLDCTWFYR